MTQTDTRRPTAPAMEPWTAWETPALFDMESETTKPATAKPPQDGACPLCPQTFRNMPEFTQHARTHIH